MSSYHTTKAYMLTKKKKHKKHKEGLMNQDKLEAKMENRATSSNSTLDTDFVDIHEVYPEEEEGERRKKKGLERLKWPKRLRST